LTALGVIRRVVILGHLPVAWQVRDRFSRPAAPFKGPSVVRAEESTLMREFHMITRIWTFTCLSCRHTWQGIFEECHGDDGHVGDAVTWRHAGFPTTPPHSDPCCPGCLSLQVNALPGGIRPSTGLIPQEPEQQANPAGHRPAEPASPVTFTASADRPAQQVAGDGRPAAVRRPGPPARTRRFTVAASSSSVPASAARFPAPALRRGFGSLRERARAFHRYAGSNDLGRLAGGQDPCALFITCADSRIIPTMITAAGPGDLFELRTAGNIVPPYRLEHPSGEAATIEYAVAVLGVPDIIVCGHSHCGAVSAATRRTDLSAAPMVGRWLAPMIHEAAASRVAGPRSLQDATQQHVLAQVQTLRTYPAVRDRLDRGQLRLHGWFYEIETGAVHAHRPGTRRFLPL
jgi:carbonic anhydrase